MLKKMLFGLLFVGLISIMMFGVPNKALAQEIAAETPEDASELSRGGRPDDRVPARGGSAQGGRYGNSSMAGQGVAYTPIGEQEIEALQIALDDEYHALAVYQSVIDTFGPVDPFVWIAQSEQQHISALLNQFEKHNLSIPENSWLGEIPPFDSVQAACAAGAEAEIANASLYDQLFARTDDPALLRVFTNLSRASLESHLPQFEICR